MTQFDNGMPKDFTDLVALPQNTDQAMSWQKANQSWWESHPMRYDWKENIACEEFSRDYNTEIDRRFFASARVHALEKDSF